MRLLLSCKNPDCLTDISAGNKPSGDKPEARDGGSAPIGKRAGQSRAAETDQSPAVDNVSSK
jgi:hypothetical protein